MFKVTEYQRMHDAWKEGDDEPELISENELEHEFDSMREMMKFLANDCCEWSSSPIHSIDCLKHAWVCGHTEENYRNGKTIRSSYHISPMPDRLYRHLYRMGKHLWPKTFKQVGQGQKVA
jgi:hypothetical protein